MDLLPCWMPKMIKQKIGLLFGYYTSNREDRSISVVVRCLVGPVDFCAIMLLIAGLLLLRAFSKNPRLSCFKNSFRWSTSAAEVLEDCQPGSSKKSKY